MAYIGVNGYARAAKEFYIGVNGTARKVKKAYVGDANGVARLWWGDAGTGGEDTTPMLYGAIDAGTPYYVSWDRYEEHKTLITEIAIVDKYTPVGNETYFWDGGKNVKCYRIDNKVIIAGNGSGKIRINSALNLFTNYSVLERITGLDLLDTSGATSMYGMFNRCHNLTELDLSSWDTSNVVNMGWMFGDCRSLTKVNLSNFDTGNVEYMFDMFWNCYSLPSLDLTSFDTSSVIDMEYMFYGCQSLKQINATSGKWNTSNADTTNMFHNCGTSAVTYV